MSDIDIERLRRAADEWDASEQETDWQPLAEAARFLLDLADEGGELWQEKRCEEHDELERHSLGRHCDHPDDGKSHDLDSGVCRIEWCPGGSRVRVWPKAGRDDQSEKGEGE